MPFKKYTPGFWKGGYGSTRVARASLYRKRLPRYIVDKILSYTDPRLTLRYQKRKSQYKKRDRAAKSIQGMYRTYAQRKRRKLLKRRWNQAFRGM